MSLQDTIAPTPERLRRDQFERPQKDQKIDRPAFRVLSQIEKLHKDGRISDACNEAAAKLTKHYLGSLGVDVSDGFGGEPLEFPRSYHSQKFAEAERVINHRLVWWALIELIQETGTTVEDIGRKLYGYSQRQQAHAAGLATVSQALHRIATHWGMAPDEFHDVYR